MRSLTAWLCALGLIAVVPPGSGCNGGQSGEPISERFEEVRSPLKRELEPDVGSDRVSLLANGNRAFALDMYRELATQNPGEGLFFSPFSVSIALAMTYAGAAGSTADAMADTLSFELEEPELHAAFNAVDLALAARGRSAMDVEEPFELHVTNSIWGQEGAEFLDPFLDTLALNYGAGLRTLDFAGEPEESRMIINAWVEDETEDRIMELLPKTSIRSNSLMVLVNAIYFNAAWEKKFQKANTRDADFTTAAGDAVSVPFMSINEQLGHYASAGVQAVEKRYDGGELSMVLIVPDAGQLESFEANLTGDVLSDILAGLQPQSGALSMPKWSHDGETVSLKKPLSDLGMEVAFTGAADFSRMIAGGGPYIDDVFHQAFVAVDETGTEAAAATAVVIGKRGDPPADFQLKVDRPFIYLIRDIATNTIVFMGRVTDPS